ncbi:T9SS type A sorting domain-containing protein [bacterium SCSIO 12741]|nr:T9SS type A sorting domain-containing protein [bacterium SCSIO 12741]
MSLKLYISFILSVLSVGSVQAQHWEALSPKMKLGAVGSYYHDTVTDHLYHTGEYLVSGNWGALFRWDSIGNFEMLDSSRSNTPHGNSTSSLVRVDNELYVGGNYKYLGDTNNPLNFLSVLENDTFWPTSQHIDDTGWNTSIRTLKNYKGDLLIGGIFDSINDMLAPGMVLWDGFQFKPMPLIRSRNYFAVGVETFAEYKDKLYVGGLFRETVYDRNLQVLEGDEWQAVNGWQVLGLLGDVLTMKVYKGELYIGGGFQKKYGGIANCIVKYDGKHFYELGEGFDYAVYDLEVHNGYLYVFGHFTSVDGEPCKSNVARWDGERWCQFSSDSMDNSIDDGIFYHDTMYITGGFQHISGNSSIAYQAKWTGDLETTICHPDKANIQKVGVYDVGVSELEREQETFTFFPNPTSGLVTIRSEEWMDIRVVDLSGRVLLQRSIHPGGQSMDLSDLSSGAYYLIGVDPKDLPARNGHSGLLIKY